MKFVIRAIQRVLALLRGFEPPPHGSQQDPYGWRPVPRTSPPKGRSNAVAVAEPDE